MKKSIIVAAIGTAILTITTCTVTAVKYNSLKATDYTLPQGFTVTAHTGCEGTDDNTLETIHAGAAAGADIVEIDLHFLPDGTPVLKHDEPKASEAGTLPTLDAAFEVLASLDVKMNVDVKSTDNIPAVLTLAEKHNVKDKIFFTGVEEKDVDAIKAGAPGVGYFLNIDVNKRKNTDPQYLSSLVDKVKDCGALGINLNFKGCSKELVDAFRQEKLPVSLWTANSKSEMYRCLALEPDNITTRKPSLLHEIIAE